jgi:tRNA (mo5U34)-methyltransferase
VSPAVVSPPTPAVEPVQLWYHTLELPGIGVTPGWFDLRGGVDRLPWPEIRGLRCLDLATYDGFYAFELEKRGAAEVFATDIPDHTEWDWPVSLREQGAEAIAAIAGEKGRGFELAHEALGSKVQKQAINVYDLSPEAIGTFDVVVLGSLLLHLRDPVRALEAIRSVCTGSFMSVEAVSLPLSRLFPRRAMAELCEEDRRVQWWTVNAAGHRRLLEVAGFEVIRAAPMFAEAFGAGHPASRPQRQSPRERARSLARRLALGGQGVPHAALLARPRPRARRPGP